MDSHLLGTIHPRGANSLEDTKSYLTVRVMIRGILRRFRSAYRSMRPC